MKKTMTGLRMLGLNAACCFALAGALPAAHAGTFTIGDSDFLLDGKPFQIKAGEMHPSRVPHRILGRPPADDSRDGIEHSFHLRFLERA